MSSFIVLTAFVVLVIIASRNVLMVMRDERTGEPPRSHRDEESRHQVDRLNDAA